MRWVLACTVALVGVASARVIMIPPVARACGEQPTWDAVGTCAAQFGTMKVERTLPHAKLVRITHPTEGVRGLYLFVEAHGAWRLGGMYEAPAEVLAFDTVTFGGHRVYRVELGITQHEEVGLDTGITSARGVILRREQMYCTGTGYRCSTVMTSCDVLVGGTARFTFRGKVTWEKAELRVKGDRTHAGVECEQSEDVPLMFPDDTE